MYMLRPPAHNHKKPSAITKTLLDVQKYQSFHTIRSSPLLKNKENHTSFQHLLCWSSPLQNKACWELQIHCFPVSRNSTMIDGVPTQKVKLALILQIQLKIKSLVMIKIKYFTFNASLNWHKHSWLTRVSFSTKWNGSRWWEEQW